MRTHKNTTAPAWIAEIAEMELAARRSSRVTSAYGGRHAIETHGADYRVLAGKVC